MALAKALYSALVLNLAMVGFYFELQEIKFLPKKTQYPPVDFWSSGQPAQSASEKVAREWEELARKCETIGQSVFKHKICFTACQCETHGLCINWHTRLSEKVKSR